MIRRNLHRLSHNVVLKRRLPKEFGSVPLFVSPESALAYWKRDTADVDPFLLSMEHELVRPGMQVWDIAANVGLFSFAAAALVQPRLLLVCRTSQRPSTASAAIA